MNKGCRHCRKEKMGLLWNLYPFMEVMKAGMKFVVYRPFCVRFELSHFGRMILFYCLNVVFLLILVPLVSVFLALCE